VRSDIGLTRANNQDSAYAGPHLLVVADGMGGHAGGDIASSVAIAHLAELDEDAPNADQGSRALQDAVEGAHDELLDRVEEQPELAGLGTTVTTLLRSGDRLVLGHIGDSRAYLLRDGELEQVTQDHTFVQYLVDVGRLAPEQAERHPQRSLLLRVLGDVELSSGLDISVRKAIPGDRWLLCSDGLSAVVSTKTLARTLVEETDPNLCADALVELALRGGGPDNITCVVADVLDLDDLPADEVPSTAPQVAGAAAIDRDKPTRGGGGAAGRAAQLAAAAKEQGESQDSTTAKRRRRRRRAAGGDAGKGVQDASAPPGGGAGIDGSDVSAGAAGSGAGGETVDGDNVSAPREDGADPAATRRRRRRGLVAAVVVVLLAAVAGGLWGAYRWSQQQYYVGESDGEVVVMRGIPQDLFGLELSRLDQHTGYLLEDDLTEALRRQVEDHVERNVSKREALDWVVEAVALSDQDRSRPGPLSSPSAGTESSQPATPDQAED
jgi:protein phosphatase